MATGKKKPYRGVKKHGGKQVLLRWPSAEESPPDEVEFEGYRIVGGETSPGVFEHSIEGQNPDSMGDPAWRRLSAEEILGAISDLAWHLWKKNQ